MPWTGEKDPYKVWLREVILQQTRVEQGVGYFNRIIAHYPTVGDLAGAKDSDVFKLWEGLGYYSRCRNMLATARAIHHAGTFPTTYEQLVKLKGIGPYTAAAIASFANNLPHAVLDGNVFRVLSRYFGESVPIDSTQGKNFFNDLASKLLYQADPALYNQAIMDFGATVCTPKKPYCDACPLSTKCLALKRGMVNELPMKGKKLVKTNRWFTYFLLSCGNKLWIRTRSGKDIWQNLNEFYLIETDKPKEWIPDAIQHSLGMAGISRFKVLRPAKPFTQHLTHQVIHGQFICVEVLSKTPVIDGYRLVSIDELESLAFPRMIRSFLQQHAALQHHLVAA